MTTETARGAETVLKQHYADVRARLWGHRPSVRRVHDIVLPIPGGRSLADVAAPLTTWHCPLNMLAPCSGRFLLRLAALRHGVTEAQLCSTSRQRRLTKARHEVAYLAARHTIMSTTQIGVLLGGRDHTTIVNSLRHFPPLNRPNYYARMRETAGARRHG